VVEVVGSAGEVTLVEEVVKKSPSRSTSGGEVVVVMKRMRVVVKGRSEAGL
jgi:hypothetical protein